jgi:hypothetical protein
MAQTYTLEEAAERLGISTDEMKRRLKDDWKSVRSFRDGPTLRFRAADIDELARSLGAMSDPSLPLAPIAEEIGSDDFKVPGSSPKKPKPADDSLHLDASDDDIFSLSSSGDSKTGKKPPKKDGDSDVRLESSKIRKAKKDEASVIPTEEISIDFSGPGSAIIKGGSSAKLSAPKSSNKLSGSDSKKNLSNPSQGDSSEFELSLDADSDDFELQLSNDTSDEVPLGGAPKGGKRGGESGINLHKPSDGGINLEGRSSSAKHKPKKPADDDSDDFELSVDPSPGPKSVKLSGPKSNKIPVTSDSDSEFELTLDDSSGGSSLEHAALRDDSGEKNDIFETDFEIPPMQDDSGSEAVAVEDTDLDRSGEVELALDDSDVLAEEETGSQVVLIEDDDTTPAPQSKGGWKGKSGVKKSAVEDLAGVELEEDDEDLGAAVARRKRLADAEEDEEELATPSGVAAPAKWGVLPALFLFPALVLTLVGGLMGYELLRTMWGYQQPRKPAAPLVQAIAKQLDMEVKDQ